MTKVKNFLIESELVFEEKPTNPKFCDLTGQRFERLFVLGYAGKSNSGTPTWFCRCDCGNITRSHSPSLKSRGTKSCGCFSREGIIERSTTHGQSCRGKWTKTYRAWWNMVARCTVPSSTRYKNYGGRGIQVCDSWLKFENFLNDMGECPPGMTLERVDNDGNYCPENCKWAGIIEQANNKRNNVFLEYNGQKLTISQWEKKLGFKRASLWNRIKAGWPIERALTTPVKINKKI